MRISTSAQRLHPIIHRGVQWAVTTYGVEALNGTYAIPKDRLTEPDWEEHMHRKTWVNKADFSTVLALARAKYSAGVGK